MSSPPRVAGLSGTSPPGEGSADLLGVAARLASEGSAFALITVVRAARPTSGKPGDKAILTESGQWLGWVGGSCAEPTARRAARAALEDGECRLIHLTNDESDFSRSGVEVAAMTCHSGGSLELYVEPHLPQPSLVVFGHSPIARAVCRLGALMKYRVTRVNLDADPGAPEEALDAAAGSMSLVRDLAGLSALGGRVSFVVVASHGQFEIEALGWALTSGARYVGLVASERRWTDVRSRLAGRGLGAEQLARLRAPAGLRIGASGPEEVALSVLSEIVAQRRGAALGVAAQERAHVDGAQVAPRPPASGGAAAAPATLESCCGQRAVQPSPMGAPGCCAAPAEKKPTFSAIVLAAGFSRRMGAPNKLLLPVGGRAMIQHVLENVLAAGFAEVVVVLGHQAPEVSAAIAPFGARSVVNEDFASGQVSSVRAGLGALRERTDAVMICLADQPLLTAADLSDAQAAFARRSHGSVLVPMYGEQRGNPVIIDWASAEETLSRGTHFGCRQFMDENPSRVCFWQSDNPHFIRDIDEPADYQALLVAPTS